MLVPYHIQTMKLSRLVPSEGISEGSVGFQLEFRRMNNQARGLEKPWQVLCETFVGISDW